jgi:hypothetical protein
MKFTQLVFLMLAAALAGCVHVDETTREPVRGIVLDPGGSPVAGAQVWATVSMPGGLMEPRHLVASGPAMTARDGRFSLTLKPVRMLQTGTIFDGDVSPSVLVLDRRLGAIGTFNMDNEKNPGFLRIRFEAHDDEADARASALGMLNELPEPEQTQARNYLEGKK